MTGAQALTLATAALWSDGFSFTADGVPVVRIGVAAGLERAEFEFSGGSCVAIPQGGPAKIRKVVGVETVAPDAVQVEAALAAWRVRSGGEAYAVPRGALYSFSGSVVDTRRVWIALPKGAGEPLERVEAPPTGGVSLSCADGVASVWRFSDARYQGVRYPGNLLLTLDAAGLLAIVNEVDAETVLGGVVPAETYPAAAAAALQAQAIAARNQLLARLGARHVADPFHLCAKTHCQAYAPQKATPSTSDAVRATRGRTLVRAGRLVETLYSASCGGFPADPQRAFSAPETLRVLPPADLSSPPRSWCGGASLGMDRYRWTKPAPPDLEILERGDDGRVGAVRLGGREHRGDLAVRRALGLRSGLFSLAPSGASRAIVGGGFGHGAGMCQIGAIGQAEAGRTADSILRSYYGLDAQLIRLW